MARPSKYDPDTMPALAGQLAREGLTNPEIARRLGVSASTLQDWRNKFPEFLEAIKKGKEPADVLVEAALFKRAVGYEVETVKEEEGENSFGSFSKTVRTTVHVAGEVAAQIFWLKNRRPDRWREKAQPQSAEDFQKTNFVDALTSAADEVWPAPDLEQPE